VSTVASTARIGALGPAEARSERAPHDLGLLARSGALGLVGIVASGVFQMLLVVAVTRGLGTGGAGVFLETLALFVILGRIGELGANTGLVRTVPRFRALRQTVDLHRTLVVAAWPVALVGASLALATFALAPQLAHVFFDAAHEEQAAELIRMLAPLVPLTAATTVALAATRGFGTMMPYVLVQNVALPAVRFLAVFAVVVVGLGSVAAGIAWALPMAAAFAAAIAVLVRQLRRAQRSDARSTRPARSARELASEFWWFSAPRGVAGILGIAVTWMDVLLVGALRSTREAAIYAAASRMAIVGAYALQAVGMAIAPRISALLAREEGERVEALYRTATWWLMALVWPFYMVLAVCSPWIMGVFGPEFAAGATALTILSLAMLVNLATGNVTTVLLMGGKSSWSLFNAATSLAINITLNLLLTPSMGITGTAIAWAASLTFVNLAPVVQVRLFLRLRPPWGSGFVLVGLAAAGCYGALGLATRYGLGLDAASVAVFVVTATGIYIPLLWPFRELLRFSELLNGLQLRGRGPRLGRRTAQAATD
jgi:O-antigen/teichoic acid export membrane protein